MSTNNNRLGKEIKPVWVGPEAESQTLKRLSSSKLQQLMKNNLSDCNAITLSNRGITKIDDFDGIGQNLRRLDLSHNSLSRLNGFEKLTQVSLLNVSNNELKGDSAMEELRYLTELRTLNICYNSNIGSIRSHVVKPLQMLQAFIASGCGFQKVPFLRFFPELNSLVLSKNSISTIPLSDMGTFQQLCKISLGHNLLHTFPDFSSSCPNLEELRINNNHISDIPESVLALRKLKTLDVSHNKLFDWSAAILLSGLGCLTNLTIKGNPLPAPPKEVDQLTIREDVAADSITDISEKRYRRYILSMFQKLVGKEQKPLVQLIVLDMKRVKVKWTQGGAGGLAKLLASTDSAVESEARSMKDADSASPEMLVKSQRVTKTGQGANKRNRPDLQQLKQSDQDSAQDALTMGKDDKTVADPGVDPQRQTSKRSKKSQSEAGDKTGRPPASEASAASRSTTVGPGSGTGTAALSADLTGVVSVVVHKPNSSQRNESAAAAAIPRGDKKQRKAEPVAGDSKSTIAHKASALSEGDSMQVLSLSRPFAAFESIGAGGDSAW